MAFKHIRAAQKQTVGDNIAKQILVEIASYIGKDGQAAYPSYRTLAESTEVHYNTVSAKVSYLEEKGFLVVTKDGRKNKYTLGFDCDNDDDGLSHTDYDNDGGNGGGLSHPEYDNKADGSDLSQQIVTLLSQLNSRLSQIESQLSQNTARLSQLECDVSNRSNNISNKGKREEAQAPISPPHLIDENLNTLLISNGLSLKDREDVMIFVEIFNSKCHPASNHANRVENAIKAKKAGLTHEEAMGICNGFWQKSGYGIGPRPHPSQVVSSADTYRQWVSDGSPDNSKKAKRQPSQPAPRPATNPQYKRPVGVHS